MASGDAYDAFISYAGSDAFLPQYVTDLASADLDIGACIDTQVCASWPAFVLLAPGHELVE